jgi:nucleotide-binding universal stress UspA family protein
MFDKILVPVDESEPSERAAHVAADLASRYGAEVLVLHVLEQDYLYGVAVDREASEQASELVDRYVRKMKDSGLNARGDVTPAVRGHAAHAILTIADDEGADLVVIGTHGASRWGRLFGNVPEKVLRFARVPVLVVR